MINSKQPIGHALKLCQPNQIEPVEIDFILSNDTKLKQRKVKMSKIFTASMDKSIVNSLKHTDEDIKSILDDPKLTTNKKAELLEINLKIDEFIREFTNENFSVLETKKYKERYSGIQNMESRQTSGRRLFVVQWVHPLLNTLRFSKWAPARNVIQADLDIMRRVSNELAVETIAPSIGMVNVPKSEGNLADNNNKPDVILEAPAVEHTVPNRSVTEDSDSEFDYLLDPEYLRNLNITHNKADDASLGDRIHSNDKSLDNSGIDDSGLGTSQSTIKEENGEENGDNDLLNQTAPASTSAARKREMFRNKELDCFKSLPDRPSSTPTRGRPRQRGNLRGRRGRRQTK